MSPSLDCLRRAAQTRRSFADRLTRVAKAGTDVNTAPETQEAAIFRLACLAHQLCDPVRLPDPVKVLLTEDGLRSQIAIATGLAYGYALPVLIEGSELVRLETEFGSFAARFASSRHWPSSEPSINFDRAIALEIGAVGVAAWLSSYGEACARWTARLMVFAGSTIFVDVRRATGLAEAAWNMHAGVPQQ